MEARDITSKKVVVLAGGWSDEREISISSGKACEKALREAGFSHVELMDVADPDFVQRIATGGFDVAFIAMHGRYGEDGSIQGLLEILHMPYTFSRVLASAMGTEKEVAKLVYQRAGIPTPDGETYQPGTVLTDTQVDELVDRLGLPMFVKPAANGSSYGITRVTDPAQLNEALATASTQGDAAIVERCITGMEVTVPVIGNHEPMALPIIEIVTGAEFYDLKVKYEPAALHHVIPARLDPEVYKRVQELGVRAHKALGCRGVSRSDFIVTEEGEPYILETNTIPGMTESSLLHDSARHAGIEFPELCRRIVEYAFEQ